MYEYWIDSEYNLHKISDMTDEYINNCLNHLRKLEQAWRFVKPEELIKDEIKSLGEPSQKAWFVFHGKEYIKAFQDELERR